MHEAILPQRSGVPLGYSGSAFSNNLCSFWDHTTSTARTSLNVTFFLSGVELCVGVVSGV